MFEAVSRQRPNAQMFSPAGCIICEISTELTKITHELWYKYVQDCSGLLRSNFLYCFYIKHTQGGDGQGVCVNEMTDFAS